MAVKDEVAFVDGVQAGLETSPTAPAIPCPECGAETKPHHPILDDDGEVVEHRRICSKRDCRAVMALN